MSLFVDNVWVQLAVFLAVSLACLLALRPLAQTYVDPRRVPTNADRVVGAEGVVTEAIDNLEGPGPGVGGRRRLDRPHRPDAPPIPAGTAVRVLRIEGVKLIVAPIPAALPGGRPLLAKREEGGIDMPLFLPALIGPILVVILVILVILVLAANLKVVQQSQAYVIERLGAFHAVWGVGIHFKIPFIERVAKDVSLKEQVVDFAPQPVITKDNVTMQIDTVLYFQITDPKLYTYGVENPMSAIENLTATTLRNIIGDLELDQSLTSRDHINTKMRAILDEATDPWGIKVNRVELKNIMPPRDIQDSMEKQMRAERERREAILQAEGQKQSQILVAEGEKQSAILRADAAKQAAISGEGAKQARSGGEARRGHPEGAAGHRRRPQAPQRGRPQRRGAEDQGPGGLPGRRQRPGHQAHHPQRDPGPGRPVRLRQRRLPDRRSRSRRHDFPQKRAPVPSGTGVPFLFL